MSKVTIYSTPSCIYCKMAKEYFKTHDVAYEDRNVAEDDRAREEMVNKSHQLGVPVIDVNGEIVVGYNEEELAKLLGIAR